LKKIQNVKIIPPHIDLFELLAKAKLVTVITSTAGFEAALLGKPVITFGDASYNRISSVIRCEKIENLPHLIKNALGMEINQDELINYVSALLEESADYDLFSNWFIDGADYQKIKNSPGIKNLTAYIATKLNI